MELLLAIASLILGIRSLLFALITYIKTEGYKRRVRIELIRTVDDSHAFRWELMQLLGKHNPQLLESLQGRINSFNQNLFVSILSLDDKMARDWIQLNRQDKEGKVPWEAYETIFQTRLTTR